METPTTSPTPKDANDESRGRPLRILHLEQNPRDRELIRAALLQDGLACEILHAADEAEFRHALARDDIDLILCASPSRTAKGRVAQAVGVASDITERKPLQEQLLQAQKREALGQLAGGIAHDFNNLLTVINGYASLALGRDDVPDHILRPLQQIYSAGERAANLTRQLLVFSRKEEMRLAPIDLNAALENTTAMLARLVGEHIRLELVLSPGLPPVEAAPGMLEQILMNLAVNARDAMAGGGRLTVRTEVMKIDATAAQALARRRPGSFVRLSVGDTGTGIPPELLPRIFEPFFTTKKAGEGTGLGLAMVFGIMADHRGWVEVESRLGQGATFHLFLPAAAVTDSDSPDRAEAPATNSDATTAPRAAPGGETILLVEDEAPVREFARAALQHHGYRVLQATSGKDALETWKWHWPRIALLLTDMVLPDQLNGLELAKKLHAEKPSLRVLCTSGYTREILDSGAASSPNIRFLQKPYGPALLAQTVRECLDAPASAFVPPASPCPLPR